MSNHEEVNQVLLDSVFKLISTDDLLSTMMNKNISANEKLELLVLTVAGLKETCQIRSTRHTEK